MTSFYRGWAISSANGAENGIALMQQGLNILQTKGFASNLSYFMSLLAQVHARISDAQTALALSSDAQEQMRSTGEHRWLAEVNRGEVLRSAGHAFANVEKSFEKAPDVSQLQGARMFELRAAKSLARLWGDQGRHVEARDLLEPIYGWFTEGFDTADLKEAKALLNRLTL